VRAAKDEGHCAKKPKPAEGEQDDDEAIGALVQNYDLMLHYLIGHLCSADGAYQPRSDGSPFLDLFAGLGLHRLIVRDSSLRRIHSLLTQLSRSGTPCVQAVLLMVGGITLW
jgi:hypothetical protein